MKNKWYYLKQYNKLVYVHDVDQFNVLLGGLDNFMQDAQTNIMRQSVTLRQWKMLKPKLIKDPAMNVGILKSYGMGYQHEIVGVYKREKKTNYITNSKVLPCITDYHHE